MHLLFILVMAFIASTVFYFGSHGLVSPSLIAVTMFVLFTLGLYILLPSKFQGYIKQNASLLIINRKRAFALNAAWEHLATAGHLEEAYSLASRDGHLDSLQRRLSLHNLATIKVGELWTALELSRIDAGLKHVPEQRVFRKHNTFQA